MTLNKHDLDLGWCIVHFEVTDMISDEVFVWVEGVRKPSKREYVTAVRLARKVSAAFLLYANIDSTNEKHMRFAHHFGFREVRRAGTISVQVWEKDRCKRHF